jgi:hypothetical protein
MCLDTEMLVGLVLVFIVAPMLFVGVVTLAIIDFDKIKKMK